MRAWPPEVGELVERRAHGAAGVEHVVHDHHGAVRRSPPPGSRVSPTTGRGPIAHQVVAVQGDVEGSVLLGGMVGVMSRSGGTRGIVEAHAAAGHHRRGVVSSDLAVRHDHLLRRLREHADRRQHDAAGDGPAARPREKLAYIVDSTAAPMAAIAVISTWVGFEISLIGDALQSAAAQATDPAWLQASCWREPAIRSACSCTRSRTSSIRSSQCLRADGPSDARDFGPMLTAERARGGWRRAPAPGDARADVRRRTEPEPPASPHRWYNAASPSSRW
jgi:hypothetical protein